MDIILKAKKKHNLIASILTGFAFVAGMLAIVYGSREEGAGIYMVAAGFGTLVCFPCLLYGLWPKNKTVNNKTYSKIAAVTGTIMAAGGGNAGAAIETMNNARLAARARRPLFRKQWGNWAITFLYWGIAPLNISLIIGTFKETGVWSPFSSFMLFHLIVMMFSAFPAAIWYAADNFKYYGLDYTTYKKRLLVMASVMIAIELVISIITIITCI